MTLSTYLRIFRERWRLVALVVLLATGVAVLITALTPKTYEASAQVFVRSNTNANSSASQYDPVAAAQNQVTTFSNLICTPDVVRGVLDDLRLPLTQQQLCGKLSADAPAQQTLINIHATDGSPSLAAAIANSTANTFATVIQDLNRPTDSSKPTVRLSISRNATTPSSPVTPNVVLNIVLGLFLGILLGAALAVARDLLDNRIKSVDDLAKLTGKPAMGIVVQDTSAPRHPIASRAGQRNARAENFRQLRANLQFANLDQHPRVIAITSSVPTEGKTMVAMNLASTLAEAGFSVCLVDADLRRPSVARTLGLPATVGLTNVLIQQIALAEALQRVGSNLFVLSSGPTPPNPSEVLASSYVRDVVTSLLEIVDYIVIDTAPLLPVADGSEVAALAEGVLLVARDRLTTEAQVKRAMALLHRVNATVLGVVLNGVSNKRAAGYSYGYYRDDDESSGKSRRRGDESRSRHQPSRPRPESRSADEESSAITVEENA